MKKLGLLLLLIPILSFGQKIAGTAWKITEDNGTQKIVMLLRNSYNKSKELSEVDANRTSGNFMDYTFNGIGLKVGQGNSGENYTWSIEGKRVLLSYNNGYQLYSGIINDNGDYIEGTSMNKRGYTTKWFGELIEF